MPHSLQFNTIVEVNGIALNGNSTSSGILNVSLWYTIIWCLNGTLNGLHTFQSTIGHRECNDHAVIPFCLIATYFYRIIRHFCIRLSLIVLCHTFITDTIECQNTAIILCMYTNHNNAHHCYHTHILTRLLYKS